MAAALHAEFWCDRLGRGFGVLQLPGSCWLFSMPDALWDGVSWGGQVGRPGGKERVMGAWVKVGGSKLKAVVENQADEELNVDLMVYEMACRFALINFAFPLANQKETKSSKYLDYLCDEAAL